MKKSFLFSLAALALVACAKDAAVKVADSNGIKFNTVVDYSSRGTAVTTSTLESFKAYGFYGTSENVFDGVIVNRAGNSGSYTWNFDGNATYPWPGRNEVTFYAYAPTTGFNGVTVSKAEQKVADFSPEIKAEAQIDPVFTKATGTEALNGTTGVTLTFKHILAQTEIKAQIKAASGYAIKVLSSKIERANKTATFTLPSDFPNLTEAAWMAKSGEEKKGRFVAIQPISASKVVDLDESSYKSVMMERGNFFTLPQSGMAWNGEATDVAASKTDNEGLWIGLAVIISKDGKQIYPVKRTDNEGKYGYIAFPMQMPTSGKFLPGKKYTYQILLGGTTLGQVPPTKDGFEDPSDPNNKDIDKTPNKDKDGGDQFKPGDPIKSANIVFNNVTVTDYEDETVITIGG